MAIFHVAASTPTKADLLARWVPAQSWCPADTTKLSPLGTFHFDDPAGQVGMETHLLDADGTTLHVPLTYRDTPVEAYEHALVGTLEHSALGTRYIYDGLSDECYLMAMAGVALTGQGHALGMAQSDGRWYAAPENVALSGGGWRGRWVAVDRFEQVADADNSIAFANERFDLTLHRQPTPGPQPSIGLRASWVSQPAPVVLAEISDRGQTDG